MKNVTIIGGGFAGLAACWECVQRNYKVTLYDAKPLAGGTSGMAAGLLHPFTGVDAKLAWRGFEAMEAAETLLTVAEEAKGGPCASRGIQRMALSERQRAGFAKTALAHPSEVEWSDPNLFIWRGYAVFARQYLEGLWRACAEKGAVWVEERVTELPPADVVIVAAGYESGALPYCADLTIHPVKGQLIEYRWDHAIPVPKYALNAVGYLLMTGDQQRCIVGSTYEHDFSSVEPDMEAALPWLLPRITPFFPEITQLKTQECRAGVRASTPDHHPIVRQIGPAHWALTGFGSKGLLYSALMARELVARF